jgi:hypothetical protein
MIKDGWQILGIVAIVLVLILSGAQVFFWYKITNLKRVNAELENSFSIAVGHRDVLGLKLALSEFMVNHENVEREEFSSFVKRYDFIMGGEAKAVESTAYPQMETRSFSSDVGDRLRYNSSTKELEAVIPCGNNGAVYVVTISKEGKISLEPKIRRLSHLTVEASDREKIHL